MKVIRVNKVVHGKHPKSLPKILYGEHCEINDVENRCDRVHDCIFEGTDAYQKKSFICSCTQIFRTGTAALDHFFEENNDVKRNSGLASMLTYIGSTKEVTQDLLPSFINETGLSELELSECLFHKEVNQTGEPFENDIDKNDAESLWQKVLETNRGLSTTPRQVSHTELVTPAGNIDVSPVKPEVCPFPKKRMLVEWILKSKGLKLPYGIVPILARHIGMPLKQFQCHQRVRMGQNGPRNQFEEYFTEAIRAEGETVYDKAYAEYCNSDIAKSRKRERKHRKEFVSRNRILIEQLFFSKGFQYHPGMDLHLANEFGIRTQYFSRMKIRRRNSEKKGIENPYVKYFDDKTKNEADSIFRRATKKIRPTKGPTSLRPPPPEEKEKSRIAKCIMYLKGGTLPYGVKPLIAESLRLTYAQVHGLSQREIKERNRGEKKKNVDIFTDTEKKAALEIYDKAVIDVRRNLMMKKRENSVVQSTCRRPVNTTSTSFVKRSFIPTECLFLVKGCNFPSSLDNALASCLNVDHNWFSKMKQTRRENNKKGIINPYVKYLNETTEMSANETYEIAGLEAEMIEENEANINNRLYPERQISILSKQCLDNLVINDVDKIPKKSRYPNEASAVTYSTKLVSSSSKFNDFDKKQVLQCLFHLKGVQFPTLLIGLLTQSFGVSMNSFNQTRKLQIWLENCGQSTPTDFSMELKQKVSDAYDEAWEIYSSEVHYPFHKKNVFLKNDHHLSILSALYYMLGMNFSEELLSELAEEFGITIHRMRKIVTSVQSRNVKYSKVRERIITSKAIEDANAIWERAKKKQLATSELTHDVDWQRDFFFKTKLSTNRNVILHVLHSLERDLTSADIEIVKSLDKKFGKDDYELFKRLHVMRQSGLSDLPALNKSQTKVLQKTMKDLSNLNNASPESVTKRRRTQL